MSKVTILHNCKAIYTMSQGVKRIDQLAEGAVINGGYIVIEDGIIVKVGSEAYHHQDAGQDCEVIDMQGQIVTPGLIDCHTHLVYGKDRVHEYALKIKGVEYLDILKQGGGILATVAATRQAHFDELYEKSWDTLQYMLSCGVTTIEAKSGYGLDTETELRQLQVIKALQKKHPIDVCATYMGAHAVPHECADADDYIDRVVLPLLPLIKEQSLAQFVDVFCEQGIFSVEQSRRILTAAKKLGFQLKLHADEMTCIGGAELAAELGCVSAEHLMKSSRNGFERMADKNVCGVLLPMTSFHLGKPGVSFDGLRDIPLVVALATDENPGSSPCIDLLWAMRMGSRMYRLTPKEVLSMVTINAAKAIGKESEIGSIEVNKKADLAVFRAASIDEVIVKMRSDFVTQVWKGGKIVYER